MDHATFLYDMATVMVVAGLVTILFHRYRQPVVLGYILAGVIVGPLSPVPLIRNQATINTLSELGVIFLLFSLGLEFNLRKLRDVGATSAIAATLEIALLLVGGYWLGRLFGWSPMNSLFLGAIICISSTTIAVKALSELGKSKEKFAQLIFGILIVEDIGAIILIAVLSGIAQSGSLQTGEAALTIGKLAVFLVVSLVLGFMIVPRLVTYVGRFKNDEMMLVTVLALCFGYSFIALRLGYSVALGAFLMGLLVAESREIGRIEILIRPVRDMFIAIFFVSVGLLIQLETLSDYAIPILVISLAVILGKIATIGLGVFLSGHDMRTATRSGMGLAQIGEFSFIMAGIGLAHGVTDSFLYPVAVSVSVLTTMATPYLLRSADPAVAFMERALPRTLMSYLNLYTGWVRQIQAGTQNNQVKIILRRIFGKLAIFGFLNAGALLIAAFTARVLPIVFPTLVPWRNYLNTTLWFIAILVSMPLILATFRKLKALGMILSEIGIPEGVLGSYKAELRAIVANIVLVVGMGILGIIIFLMSSTILPNLIILPILGGAFLVMAYFLRGSFNKIYFHGKSTLAETFSKNLLDIPPEAADTFTESVLTAANLDSVLIEPQHPCAGRLIRETQLRRKTGASIVGIERNGGNILNPGPDEELLPGDRILLLGSDPQLESARAFLQQPEPRLMV